MSWVCEARDYLNNMLAHNPPIQKDIKTFLDWMHRWHLGAGMMGEQGAESIHAHMMRLDRIHQGIANDVE